MQTNDLTDAGASAHAPSNGASTDDAAVAAIRKEIASRRVRYDELRAELDELTPELRRYEKALALLTGETAYVKPGPKGGPKLKPEGKIKGKQNTDWNVSDERMEIILNTIRAWADDHDEFRQTDIRIAVGYDGNTISKAFERLRQAGMIRLARQQGTNKYFRLTRAAMRGQDNG
jgi:DNA-binding transcriptional ArsR family regulator